MSFFLGLDISTTATKALLLDETGEVAAVAATEHEVQTPRPLWSEQDPAQWWTATQQSIREALGACGAKGEAVAAVGLTGQMHGLVLLDNEGTVLRPAMLWNDGRADDECDWIRDQLGRDRLVELTGNEAFEGFTAPKLLWVRRHEPEVYAQVAQVLLPKDYVRFRLTGEYATDKAGAGGTLLLDLERRDWSADMQALLDIPDGWLPSTHEGTTVTGQISTDVADATGLASGTPVMGGGGDQAAQALGGGVVQPGQMGLTLGTSGVVFAPTDRPVVAPQGRAHAFPHAVPGRWHLMGVMLSAAGSLRWYHDTFAPDASYEALLADVDEAPPGADGLTFLPYLSGERTPHANPHATGTFFGLTVRHERAHVTRSVLEGVAFGLQDNVQLLREAGVPAPEEMRISGGGAQNKHWRQILADVLDVPMTPLATTEGAALGAALLAGVGGGGWSNIESACDAAVTTGAPTNPNPENTERYAQAYERFQNLYPRLEPFFVKHDTTQG